MNYMPEQKKDTAVIATIAIIVVAVVGGLIFAASFGVPTETDATETDPTTAVTDSETGTDAYSQDPLAVAQEMGSTDPLVDAVATEDEAVVEEAAEPTETQE